MTDSSTPQKSQMHSPDEAARETPVHVMYPEQASYGRPDSEISLREIWHTLWHGKWLIIGVTTVFAVASVIYALLAEEWYRSEVLIAPADVRSTPALGGQLGGLAALAGVSVGGGGSSESLAVLQSRDFIRLFIEEYELMPLLYQERWDPVQSTWVLGEAEQPPDIREAVKYFQEDILRVDEERDTGLVTIAVEWKDPELAAEWASALVRRLNDHRREIALQEAETNVAYLRSELGATTVITLQQSIGRLLENELQKLMLARGNEEFAFKVLDRAAVPTERIRPRRALLAVIGTALGMILSVFAVFVMDKLRIDFATSRAIDDR